MMDPGKAVPVTATARIKHWCLFLGVFSYSIEFRGTRQDASWDALSRLPYLQTPADKPDEAEMFHAMVVEAVPVTEQKLRMQTRKETQQFLESQNVGNWVGKVEKLTQN